MRRGLQGFLKNLAEGASPPPDSRLTLLSQLEPSEEAPFRLAWKTVPVQRRRHVSEQLNDMAEDNDMLDFNAVFLVCLEDEDPEIRRQYEAALKRTGVPCKMPPVRYSP